MDVGGEEDEDENAARCQPDDHASSEANGVPKLNVSRFSLWKWFQKALGRGLGREATSGGSTPSRKRSGDEGTATESVAEGLSGDVSDRTIINILLLGKMGSGKSACANAMSGELLFDEDPFSMSGSEEHQLSKTVIVSIDGRSVKLRFLEMLGYDNPALWREENVHEMISVLTLFQFQHILIVSSGRLARNETLSFDLVCNVLFGDIPGIADRITLVRSNFQNFLNEEMCRKDISWLANHSDDTRHMMHSIGNRVVHVDVKPNLQDGMAGLQKERMASRKKLLEILSATSIDPYVLFPSPKVMMARFVRFMEVENCPKEELARLQDRVFQKQIARSDPGVAAEGARHRLQLSPESAHMTCTGKTHEELMQKSSETADTDKSPAEGVPDFGSQQTATKPPNRRRSTHSSPQTPSFSPSTTGLSIGYGGHILSF